MAAICGSGSTSGGTVTCDATSRSFYVGDGYVPTVEKAVPGLSGVTDLSRVRPRSTPMLIGISSICGSVSGESCSSICGSSTSTALTGYGDGLLCCPHGMNTYGDGSACKDGGKSNCALCGNANLPRCSGEQSPGSVTKIVSKLTSTEHYYLLRGTDTIGRMVEIKLRLGTDTRVFVSAVAAGYDTAESGDYSTDELILAAWSGKTTVGINIDSTSTAPECCYGIQKLYVHYSGQKASSTACTTCADDGTECCFGPGQSCSDDTSGNSCSSCLYEKDNSGLCAGENCNAGDFVDDTSACCKLKDSNCADISVPFATCTACGW